MKYYQIAICVLASALLCGCSRIEDPVIDVSTDDQAMNEAMAKAKATFPKFLANWETIEADTKSVKIGVPTADGGVEHIWFEPTIITDDQHLAPNNL